MVKLIYISSESQWVDCRHTSDVLRDKRPRAWKIITAKFAIVTISIEACKTSTSNSYTLSYGWGYACLSFVGSEAFEGPICSRIGCGWLEGYHL
jgi:hypothetical protein